MIKQEQSKVKNDSGIKVVLASVHSVCFFCLVAIFYLFASNVLYAGISVDTSDLNKGIEESIGAAEKYEKELKRRRREAAEKERNKPFKPSSRDMQSWCLAASGKYPKNCYSIKNEDAKWACLGMVEKKTNCYSVKNHMAQSLCLARADFKNRKFCYSILNPDIQNTCLGITEKRNFCYAVKDRNWQSFCLGLVEKHSHCYSIPY